MELDALVELLAGRRTVVLTGAGCSTESGIPDYRGPGTARRARNPMQYREFLASAAGRQRYWARSVVGWPRFCRAKPNRGHAALAALEQDGHVLGIITQNVDRLHTAAGSQRVVELHGALAEVRCLGCGAVSERAVLQERLLALNPGYAARSFEFAPDGDADVPAELVAGFAVADCAGCGGALKPNVVFFGENVPRPVVESAYALLDQAEALLVVGSSLVVFSGYRFVKRASERGLPVAIVNLGETRGDRLAQVVLAARASEALCALQRRLSGAMPAPLAQSSA